MICRINRNLNLGLLVSLVLGFNLIYANLTIFNFLIFSCMAFAFISIITLGVYTILGIIKKKNIGYGLTGILSFIYYGLITYLLISYLKNGFHFSDILISILVLVMGFFLNYFLSTFEGSTNKNPYIYSYIFVILISGIILGTRIKIFIG